MIDPIEKFKITKGNYEEFLDNDEMFEYAYEFYLLNGEMPYGTAKARDGDPYEWVFSRIESELYGI